jgi:hypothetical protein
MDYKSIPSVCNILNNPLHSLFKNSMLNILQLNKYDAKIQILWMIYKNSNIQINPVFIIQNCQKFAIL